MQLLNTEGRLIKQFRVNIVNGINQANIAINGIQEGMYFIKINKRELNIIRKLVIAR